MLKGKNYMITKKNILAHEFIGLKASVIESPEKSRKKTTGIVVDETKNTIRIMTSNGEKMVPKKEAVFEFFLGDEQVTVEGEKIIFRPQDRVKIFWRSC